MADVASTNTFRPSKLNTLSITPGAFSKDMEYENPEHPPPTTPMRRPAGSGSCWVMISFTLETAVEVRLIGLFGVVSTLGVVVEAIQKSLLKGDPLSNQDHYSTHSPGISNLDEIQGCVVAELATSAKQVKKSCNLPVKAGL